MKALVLKEKNQFPAINEVSNPVADDSHIVVKIKAAALNHRDMWIAKSLYPGIKYPVILGSDGAGLVGEREVVIQPGINWGDSPDFQSKAYHILGSPFNGTFAEYIAVEPQHVFDKPGHLSFVQAAALPLGGLTAFRVLFTRCAAKPGETVLITGAGGGVALFCLQFALAAGLNAFVTSGSPDKIDKAISMGAMGGVNYSDENWPQQLESMAGNFDIIIDSAGGDGFTSLVKLCKPGGRIGVYGGSKGTIPNISPQVIFWRQISILGSTMGTNEEFGEMLNFVSRHQIVPVVDSVFDLEESQRAFQRMEKGEQFGKIVLNVSK